MTAQLNSRNGFEPTVGFETFESTDPSNGQVLGELRVFEAEDVAEVVSTARDTAVWWRSIGFSGRAACLRRWRRYIWRHRAALADLVHRENGKPVADAIVEIGLTVEHIRWAERNAKRALRSRRVSPGLLLANFSARVDVEPMGVVGVISPWNYPVYAANSAVAYALAAGNTVVLKPSEHTPLAARWYVDAFEVSNPAAPDGVLSAVHGFGDTGRALCRSGVDKVAFTGSTSTGKAVMTACAESLTPVVLECGGKDAAIVDSDADLVAAAQAIAWGGYTNAGQTCVGVERVYVLESAADRLLELLAAQLRDVKVGGAEPSTYGPMTMAGQVDVFRRHLDEARADGGQVVVGPSEAGDHGIREGRFVEPVLISEVDETSAAVREETFGPVLTVKKVASIEEAVRLANAGSYGLGASVFSRSRGEEIASRLEAGQVCLDSVVAFAGMGSVPMGGTKESGFGRLHGLEGFAEFSRPRGVVRKRFAIPGFELMALHRRRFVMPILEIALSVRHRMT